MAKINLKNIFFGILIIGLIITISGKSLLNEFVVFLKNHWIGLSIGLISLIAAICFIIKYETKNKRT